MDLMACLYRIAGGVTAIAGVGLGLLYCLQEKLIYLPRVPGVSNDIAYYPDRFGFKYEDVWLSSRDVTKLHAWFMWPASWSPEVVHSKPVVIFFQENAGNMSWRLPFLKLLSRYLEASILAPSYRGYGLSEGRPNEQGLQLDAQAALDYLLTQRQDINRRNILVFGRSLGGAVAIHLAATNPGKIRALMVENTFSSIAEVAPKMFPPLVLLVGPGRPFNFLIRNKWDNAHQIGQLADLPVLLMSSLQDEMLPPAHMKQLYQLLKAAGSQRVVWVEFPLGTHMDAYEVCRAEYWPALMSFHSKYGQSAEAEDADEPGNGVCNSHSTKLAEDVGDSILRHTQHTAVAT